MSTKITPTATSAVDIANRIIYLYSQESVASAETLSPLKLQKLLYYVQGVSLGRLNTEAFSEELLSWKYGPVCESIYFKFKSKGTISLTNDDIEGVEPNIPYAIDEIIMEVIEDFKDFLGTTMVDYARREKPWLQTYSALGENAIIDKNLIREYFSLLLNTLELIK